MAQLALLENDGGHLAVQAKNLLEARTNVPMLMSD